MNIHDYIHFMHDGSVVAHFQTYKGDALVTRHQSVHRTGWSAVTALISYCLRNNVEMDEYNELQWRRYYSDYDRHVEYMLADKGKMSKGKWEMAFSCDAPNKPGYHRANND